MDDECTCQHDISSRGIANCPVHGSIRKRAELGIENYGPVAVKNKKDFNGVITVRMSPELHKRIWNASQKSEKSMNQWIIGLIEEKLGLDWETRRTDKEVKIHKGLERYWCGCVGTKGNRCPVHDAP